MPVTLAVVCELARCRALKWTIVQGSVEPTKSPSPISRFPPLPPGDSWTHQRFCLDFECPACPFTWGGERCRLMTAPTLVVGNENYPLYHISTNRSALSEYDERARGKLKLCYDTLPSHFGPSFYGVANHAADVESLALFEVGRAPGKRMRHRGTASTVRSAIRSGARRRTVRT
jgi:hypothetical protein